MLYNVTAMKQYQQANYTAKETAVQVVLPLDVETIIPEDDSVRTLMRIAERINYTKLSGAYERVSPREATPKQMFLLVVLGYMEGKYSTRKIEKACGTDTRFMWILGGKPAPDHTRISRFLQRISGEILEDLFYQVVHLLHEDGEIAYEHLFVDGTKIEANANRYTFVWRKRVEKGMAKLSEKQEKLAAELGVRYAFELGNTQEPKEMLLRLKKLAQEQKLSFVYGSGKRKEQLQRDIEALEEIVQKAREYAEHIAIMGERNSYSKTDHSATFMRMKDDHMQNGQLKPGYNVQLGIEAEYIVGVDVTSDLNDTHALLPLLERMEEKGGIKHQDVTTDAGYETEETYSGMEKRGQTAYIKPQNYERSKKRSFRQNAYLWENMPYDKEKDCFTCPAGKELRFSGVRNRKTKAGLEQQISLYQAENCTNCPHKEHCTKAKENRTIKVNWAFETARAASRERITSEKGILLRINRSIQSEGAFGVLKEDRHFRRLRRRGTEGVFAEILLYAIAFDIQKLHAKEQSGRLKTMLFYPVSA